MMRVKRNSSRLIAFTLVEVMIAVLFISIGFFGYVALHSRLLHSGQRLEAREVIRSGTDFVEAVEMSRAHVGMTRSIDGTDFQQDIQVPQLVTITTSPDRDMTWLQNFPEEFRPGVNEAIPMEVKVYQRPFLQRWNQR